MSEQPVYEFTMRAIDADNSGYYHPRWDRAKTMRVRGATKQEAINKAATMLGKTPRGYGWSWIFKVDDIREVTGE